MSLNLSPRKTLPASLCETGRSPELLPTHRMDGSASPRLQLSPQTGRFCHQEAPVQVWVLFAVLSAGCSQAQGALCRDVSWNPGRGCHFLITLSSNRDTKCHMAGSSLNTNQRDNYSHPRTNCKEPIWGSCLMESTQDHTVSCKL